MLKIKKWLLLLAPITLTAAVSLPFVVSCSEETAKKILQINFLGQKPETTGVYKYTFNVDGRIEKIYEKTKTIEEVEKEIAAFEADGWKVVKINF